MKGIRGLYRGFCVSLASSLIGEIVYYSSLELTRHSIKKLCEKKQLSDSKAMELMRNFTAGAVADVSCNTIQLPFEIIAERMMIQTACKSLDGPYKNTLGIII